MPVTASLKGHDNERVTTVSDQQGEVSEVSGLHPDSAPNLGDSAPAAEESDHVAQGEPRSYGNDRPEEDDPLRTGADDPGDRPAP